MVNRTTLTVLAGLWLAVVASAAFVQAAAPAEAPYVNTWLVAGTFDNDAANAGYDRDWIGETDVQPRRGRRAGM